jgi:pyridinium-3,5-biscarboxylic acid mononucleotide synthase
MNRIRLLELLNHVKAGEVKPEEAAARFQDLQTEELGYASVDHHRALRLGFPEVIFGQGKTADQIIGIARSLQARQDVILATRLDEAKAERVREALPEMEYHTTAGALLWTRGEIPRFGLGTVLVVAAGTSDLSVAEEAAVTARALGNDVDTLYDVGIAGIHRLLHHHKRLRDAAVIIAVAGMEGALPGVIGGLVDRPVVAVPTSVGYGASFGGVAALLGMLNSCAPGVVVVNIDNGFGAAYAASLMNRRAHEDAHPG